VYSSGYSATAQTRYFAGDGRQSLDSGGTVTDLRYFHGDLINSRVMATDDSGAVVATTAYTAFGEAVPPIGSPARPANSSTLDTRYQYAAGLGTEADLLAVAGQNASLLSLSLRYCHGTWHQLDTGRSLQRMPMSSWTLNQYTLSSSVPGIHAITLGVGGTASAGAGVGVGVEIGGHVGLDPRKGWSGGFIGESSGGFAGGAWAGAGIKGTITTAETVGDLKGWSTLFGANFWILGAEVFGNGDYYGLSVSVCAGVGEGIFSGTSYATGPTCGATGLECAPLVFIYLLVQKRRHRHVLSTR